MLRGLITAALALIQSVGAQPANDNGAETKGVVTPFDVVYLLDRSSAMNVVRGTTNTRCSDARATAVDDIRQLFEVLGNDTSIAVWTASDATITELTTGFVDQAEALAALAAAAPEDCAGDLPLADMLCQATTRLRQNPGPAPTGADNLLMVLSTAGGETASSGLCSGPPSDTDQPPFDDGSWQNRVRTQVLNDEVSLLARLWSDTAGTSAGGGQAKAAPSDSHFLAELAAVSGGQFAESSDQSVFPASLILSLFDDSLEIPGFGREPAAFGLAVNLAGAGQGSVDSTPTGISCGVDCEERFAAGASVDLAASPSAGSYFAGWTGACDGEAGCTVVVDQDEQVGARFELVPVVSLTASPESIEQGLSVTITWSVENYVDGVTRCFGSSGVNAWSDDVAQSPAGGSVQYFPLVNTQFELTCEQSTTSVFVEVTEQISDGFPPPPEFCQYDGQGRAIAFDIRKDFVLNPPNGVRKVNFEGVWGVWPGSNEATVRVPINQYVAMPFFANQAEGKVWSMTWVGGPSNGNGTRVSISRCPGDFSGVGYSDPRCLLSSGSEGGVILTVIGAGNACPLVGGPDEVYYLNVEHANSTGGNLCFEGRGTCGFLGQPARLN